MPSGGPLKKANISFSRPVWLQFCFQPLRSVTQGTQRDVGVKARTSNWSDFTSPIPAPLLVRNVIHDSHRCPSRLDVECPPGLFCRREENLKRQAETGNMTCNAGTLQWKSLFRCSLRTHATPVAQTGARPLSLPFRLHNSSISQVHRQRSL